MKNAANKPAFDFPDISDASKYVTNEVNPAKTGARTQVGTDLTQGTSGKPSTPIVQMRYAAIQTLIQDTSVYNTPVRRTHGNDQRISNW